jgi:hypothetical protein
MKTDTETAVTLLIKLLTLKYGCAHTKYTTNSISKKVSSYATVKGANINMNLKELIKKNENIHEQTT